MKLGDRMANRLLTYLGGAMLLYTGVAGLYGQGVTASEATNYVFIAAGAAVLAIAYWRKK